MLLNCEIVNKTSKAGNPYVQLRIVLCESPRVVKDVFLEEAELAILKLNSTT